MDETSQVSRKRRWPGLLLSFFVPGFGLIRAGLPRRGVAWLLGLILLGLIFAASLAIAAVPLWLAIVVLSACLAAQISMLRDGFRPGRMTGRLWLLFIGMFVALMIIPSPVLFIARTFRISTGGMEPTLRGADSPSGADHVIVDRLSYRISPPKRGDMLVFSTARITAVHKLTRNTGENFFIQRLVGMPGETIRISEGKVFADGKPLGESEGIPLFNHQNPSDFPSAVMQEGEDFEIGADEYFVLGDNTSNSLDSRYWGCVPSSSVLGKVTMIYYPFSRVGRVPSK